MKKILAVLAFFLGTTSWANAAEGDSILNQFYAGFVGNAKFAIESTTDGTSHGEFLDNFLEIGQLKGEHIAALDFGVLGTFLPNSQEFKAADWTTGAKIHLAPIIKNYVHLPAQYQFIGTLEIDARASYDWRVKHPFYGLVAAYPFK